MTPDSEPAGENEFAAARDRLVAEFADAGNDAWTSVVEQLLDFKWNYLDGQLQRWTSDDVAEVLFRLYPAKVLINDAAISEVVPAFAAFLRFLGVQHADGRRDRSQPTFGELATVVEQSATRFVSAMHDQSNWSFGKRMWTTAQNDGVDFSDSAAVQRWVAGFNQRSIGERDQILGQLPQPSRVGASAIGPLPPVTLAPPEQLLDAAAAAVLVQRLQALVEFVGDGVPVTDRGNLKLADGKALVTLLGTPDRVDEVQGGRVYKTRSAEDLTHVDFVYRVAVEVGLLSVERGKLRPSLNVGWVHEPLELLYGAFLVLLNRVGPTQHHYRGHRYGFDWFAEVLDEQIPSIVLELYRHREPYPVGELVDNAWSAIQDSFEIDSMNDARRASERGSVDSSVRRILDRLADAGLLSLTDESYTPSPYGFSDNRSDGMVMLTPLGLWAAQRMLSKITTAPAIGALRDCDAAELLQRAADMADDVGAAEIDTWVSARGDTAANELCDGLRSSGETGRGLAFHALLRVGPGAADAVAALADDPRFAEFVTVFRVDTLIATPDEMSRAGEPQRWVRLLHTVIELWGPQAAIAAWAAPAAGAQGVVPMLEVVWRVKDAETESVLAAIGAHHADKHVAKAARKALFKFRSSS